MIRRAEATESNNEALKQILTTVKPYLAAERTSRQERDLMKHAVLLSETQLDCIARLCKQAVTSGRRKRMHG